MQLARKWLWPVSDIPTFVWKGWREPRNIKVQSMYRSSFEWGTSLSQVQVDVTCSGARRLFTLSHSEVFVLYSFFSSSDVFLPDRSRWLLFNLLAVSDIHTHTHTHTHSLRLLWTSDQPVAETSTWQHLLTLLTYSMEQSPSWEANWFCS